MKALAKGKAPHTSIRKNPDKYIEALKREIKWLEGVRHNLQGQVEEVEGVHWFEYKENTHSVSFGRPSIAHAAHIGQRVIAQGKVVELKMDEQGNTHATMTIEGVRLKV